MYTLRSAILLMFAWLPFTAAACTAVCEIWPAPQPDSTSAAPAASAATVTMRRRAPFEAVTAFRAVTGCPSLSTGLTPLGRVVTRERSSCLHGAGAGARDSRAVGNSSVECRRVEGGPAVRAD